MRALEFWKHIPDFWIPSFGKSNVSYPCLQMKNFLIDQVFRGQI